MRNQTVVTRLGVWSAARQLIGDTFESLMCC
jgi:hypothetical protein